MITHVAIKTDDGKIYSLPKPKRHYNIFWENVTLTEQGEQGFLDENGNFLTRKQGAHYARSHKQIEKLKWPSYLYSEDLW